MAQFLFTMVMLLSMGSIVASCPYKCICLAGTQMFCARQQLTEIPENIPNDMEYVSLSDNFIEEVLKNSFNNLTNLQRLILDNNNIQYIEPYSFAGLTGLVELSLQSNPLSVLQSYSFAGMKDVQSLYLGYNKIKLIESGAFDQSDQIVSLSLIMNPIHTLQSGSFSNLSNIAIISLPKNISEIEPLAFNGLVNVTLLRIHDLNIQVLPQNSFKGLKNVSTMSLENCKIGRVQSGAFSGIDGVNYLSIKNNEIFTIDPMSFAGMSNIDQMELANNNISDLELGAFAGMKNRVHSFNFTDNMVNCDCRYHGFLTMAETTSKIKVMKNRCYDIEDIAESETFLLRVQEECNEQLVMAEMKDGTSGEPIKEQEIEEQGASKSSVNLLHYAIMIICYYFLEISR